MGDRQMGKGQDTAEPRDYFETVEGCKTRILRGGTGTPLLFLHGANGAGRWLPFMAELAKSFDVIVPEHPGYGLTDTPAWLDNVGDVANFYLSFMKKLGLENVTLVGTSMGGWIASEIAVRDVARLARLVLVAPAGLRVKGSPPGDLFLWTAEQLTRNLFHSPALAERMLALPISDDDRDVMMKNRFTTARLAWSPRLYNPELEKWIHRIDLPTLILWGRNDALLPVVIAEAFASRIPGSKLTILDECGHLPHVEKQDAFVSAVLQFAAQA
jgi:pimeloyl-ACP methyl ester carboxylesterase